MQGSSEASIGISTAGKINMSIKVRKSAVCLCCYLPFLPCVVQADTVWLTNGDRLSGTIQSLNDGELELKTDYAGILKVKWPSVSTMESESRISIGNSKTKENYPVSVSQYNAGYV